MNQPKDDTDIDDDGPSFGLLCAGVILAALIIPGVLLVGGVLLASSLLGDKDAK